MQSEARLSVYATDYITIISDYNLLQYSTNEGQSLLYFNIVANQRSLFRASQFVESYYLVHYNIVSEVFFSYILKSLFILCNRYNGYP
jgi:hypothetical protein